MTAVRWTHFHFLLNRSETGVIPLITHESKLFHWLDLIYVCVWLAMRHHYMSMTTTKKFLSTNFTLNSVNTRFTCPPENRRENLNNNNNNNNNNNIAQQIYLLEYRWKCRNNQLGSDRLSIHDKGNISGDVKMTN
jgi:hypothetical protein